MTWAFWLLYVYVPFMFMEQTAESKDVYPVGVCAAPVKRWYWPFGWWFIVLMFLLWPVIIPWATYRRRSKKG